MKSHQGSANLDGKSRAFAADPGLCVEIRLPDQARAFSHPGKQREADSDEDPDTEDKEKEQEEKEETQETEEKPEENHQA